MASKFKEFWLKMQDDEGNEFLYPATVEDVKDILKALDRYEE